nr:MAG TPA: hypothetical protein [Caudoviricetes sp.]
MATYHVGMVRLHAGELAPCSERRSTVTPS